MDDNGRFGPYDVTWIGPCIWAGIIDELPPELVGRKVYLTIAEDEPVKEASKVVGVRVEPSGTLSFEMDNGKHHVIPARYDMPDGLDHVTFVHVAMSNAILHAHERIDAIVSHESKHHTVKVLPFVNRRVSIKPADRTPLRQRIKNALCNLFS